MIHETCFQIINIYSISDQNRASEIHCTVKLARRVWRYQRGNQNP